MCFLLVGWMRSMKFSLEYVRLSVMYALSHKWFTIVSVEIRKYCALHEIALNTCRASIDFTRNKYAIFFVIGKKIMECFLIYFKAYFHFDADFLLIWINAIAEKRFMYEFRVEQGHLRKTMRYGKIATQYNLNISRLYRINKSKTTINKHL